MIPGTKLYTGIYYTLSMKSFPQGWVTWVDNIPGTYNIEIDIDPSSFVKYGPGKPFELDNQWTIGPSETSGQYTLANRRKYAGLVSYTSIEVGSGYHAAIFEGPTDRRKLGPGGEWRKDGLWKFQTDKKDDKYYKMENVGKKGSFLTWTNKMYNKFNYFIQLANYDAGDDAKFLFTPSAITLNAHISDFQFSSDPTDVFNKKTNQKRSLVSKHRYPNNSSATITQTLEESVETKESFTFAFKESFSIMTSTKIEVSFLKVASASGTISFTGGFEASQSKTKETTRKTSLKTEIKIPPFTDIEASVYSVWANNVKLPFKAKMLVTGVAKRIVAAQPSQVQDGEVPGDVIEAYIKESGGKKMKIIKRSGDSLLVEVSGVLTGNVGLESTVSTRQVKKIKPGDA